MTLKQAIAYLEQIRTKHGDEIEVFFDCPECDKSFTPNTVTKQAVHLKAETPEKEPQR